MPFQAARTVSYVPGGAITETRIFVSVNASGRVVLPAQGGDAVGVILDLSTNQGAATVDGGPAVPVAVLDGTVVEVIAGGVIAQGAAVTCGADGRAETAATGDAILGTALVAAAADGEVITINTNKAARQQT